MASIGHPRRLMLPPSAAAILSRTCSTACAAGAQERLDTARVVGIWHRRPGGGAIADGKHLPAPLLRLVYKVKGPQGICLTTDSMRAAGQEVKESILGSLEDGQRVPVEDGVAFMPDRQSFAGSVATADRLVRIMVQLADVPLAEAVRMLTHTPARVMGIDGRKGSLEPGRDADLVAFDEDIRIGLVMVEGEVRLEEL
jgi:N-acetylglucosamine-6-phosphate deacetylase